LRGALTIALALALPAETPSRGLLIAMAFGVVLFTMVVQGLSLPLVIRLFGLTREEAHVRV
jgi:CPA1 family monovalent cation:H+ antiporter